MNYILYHANCADGFSAYWVTQKALTLQGLPHSPIPGKYGTNPDFSELKHGDTLWIVDFSIQPELIQELLANGVAVIWIDHHVSAYNMYKEAGMLDISDSPDDEHVYEFTNYSYNVEKSGATLCWEYFQQTFGRHAIYKPLLLDYIEDRDLWRFKLAGSREISQEIFSWEYTIENWDRLMSASGNALMRMHASGAGIVRKHEKDIAELLQASKHPYFVDEFAIWACNLPYTMASDACHKMCKMPLPSGVLPEFTMAYQLQGDKVICSFRSLKDGQDVSKIAQRFGGGGHKNAAGCSIPLDEWMELHHGMFSKMYSGRTER